MKRTPTKADLAALAQRLTGLQQSIMNGQAAQALPLCRELAKQPPLKLAAQALEALALAFNNDAEAAVALLETLPEPAAIKQPEVLLTMATAWMRLQGVRPALALFQAVLELQPEHPLAHARLGALQLGIGHRERALPHLEKAFAAIPQSNGVRVNLARARLELGDAAGALALLPARSASEERSTEAAAAAAAQNGISSDDELYELTRSEALFALQRGDEALAGLSDLSQGGSVASLQQSINLLASRGHYARAAEQLNEALERYPDSIELLLLLADLAEVRGHFGEAAWALRQALEKQPEQAALWARLSQLSGRRLTLEESEEAAQKALELTAGEGVRPHLRSQALCARAHVEQERNELAAAEASYREALALTPESQRVLNGLGQLLMQVGRVDEAVELYEQLKSISPIAGWSQLIHARQVPEDPAILEQMEQAARRPSLEGEVRSHLLFNIASAWEKKKEYEKAWQIIEEANSATRQHLSYDPARHRDRVEREIARFSAEFMASRHDFGSDSEVPVFVLGMPRSGTTLVEQILGSHSQVHGAGELSLIPQQLQKLSGWEAKLGSGRHYPECVDDMTAAESRKFADKLLEELQGYAPEALRVVDKLPHNFEHVGLIKLLFPKAKILHLQREPRDVAISNYFIDYGAKFGGMGFAYDLRWIGEQLRDQQRLMAHWHQIFPDQILTVNYDELVEDVEGWARRIIDYLGLAWEPGVLAFQELDRAVKTASVWQVRQPVYTTSKEKWRRYEAYLAPLEEALAEALPTPLSMALPNHPPGRFLEGMEALQKGQAAAAEQRFRELLESAPEHAAAQHFLGAACYQQGRLDEAVEWIEKSLEARLRHRSWLENLIAVERARGNQQRADELQQRLDGNRPEPAAATQAAQAPAAPANGDAAASGVGGAVAGVAPQPLRPNGGGRGRAGGGRLGRGQRRRATAGRAGQRGPVTISAQPETTEEAAPVTERLS